MADDEYVPLFNRRGAALGITITFTVGKPCSVYFQKNAAYESWFNLGLGLAVYVYQNLHQAGRTRIGVVG